MERRLIIKIEDRQLSIMQAEANKSHLHITGCKDFGFPDHLQNDLRSQPAELADFIGDCLIAGDFGADETGKEIILLFDSRLGFFRQYIYKKSDKKMADKRFYVEDDNQKDKTGGSNITQRFDFPDREEDNGMSRAAIYGIGDGFLRELVKSLSRNRLKTVFATSSLIEFKTAVSRVNRDVDPDSKYKRIIAIELTSNSYKTVIMEDDKLIHLDESWVADDAKPEDKNLTDMLTDLLKEYSAPDGDTLAAVFGHNKEAEAKRLMSYSGITCRPMEKIRDLDLPDDGDYLYGGWAKRKFNRATTKICIACAVVLALLFSMLPVYSVYMTGINDDLNEKIDNYKYPVQLELLYEKRDVSARLQAYKDDLAAIGGDEMNYSEVLTILREDLLYDAIINDLIYDEKSGLIIDFDVSDVSGYENARDKLNDERKILVVETSTGEAINANGQQNVQIKVTIPHSGEASQ